jgi:hypothetical protein
MAERNGSIRKTDEIIRALEFHKPSLANRVVKILGDLRTLRETGDDLNNIQVNNFRLRYEAEEMRYVEDHFQISGNAWRDLEIPQKSNVLRIKGFDDDKTFLKTVLGYTAARLIMNSETQLREQTSV